MLVFGRFRLLRGDGQPTVPSSSRWAPHLAGEAPRAPAPPSQREIDQLCHRYGLHGDCGEACPAFGLQAGACDEDAG